MQTNLSQLINVYLAPLNESLKYELKQTPINATRVTQLQTSISGINKQIATLKLEIQRIRAPYDAQIAELRKRVTDIKVSGGVQPCPRLPLTGSRLQSSPAQLQLGLV